MSKPFNVLRASTLERLALVLLVTSVVACGDVDPSDGSSCRAGEPSDPSIAILPWAPGNTWTYRVTAASGTSTKTTTVGDEEEVGGTGPNSTTMANKVTTEKSDGTDLTESWQALVDGRVVRYREIAYAIDAGSGELIPQGEDFWDPYKLHADGTAEHTAEGVTWPEAYDETKIDLTTDPDEIIADAEGRTDLWIVVDPAECVEVPAGTFDNAIHFKKTVPSNTAANVEKDYWYVRGIGKVKEEGNQIEELLEYEVAP